MNPPYGWTITKTEFKDENPGTTGPYAGLFTADQILAQGIEFRMLDDDGELYYTGFYLGPDDQTMLAPLDDYGTPNAGATTIQYRTESGQWQAL